MMIACTRTAHFTVHNTDSAEPIYVVIANSVGFCEQLQDSIATVQFASAPVDAWPTNYLKADWRDPAAGRVQLETDDYEHLVKITVPPSTAAYFRAKSCCDALYRNCDWYSEFTVGNARGVALRYATDRHFLDAWQAVGEGHYYLRLDAEGRAP